MSNILDRRTLVSFLEDIGFRISTKNEDSKLAQKQPPKLKGKQNLEYLAEGSLVLLASNQSGTFPNAPYDAAQDVSYFDQCFFTLIKLGEGSFGSVFKVVSREDGKFYAMKVSKVPFKSDCDRTRKLEEVIHHSEFSKHPNIVNFFQAWEEDRHLYMKLELCKGNLLQSEAMPESQCWDVLADMAAALQYIHNLNYGHFDVKLENILIGYDGLYKLSDFGLVYTLSMQETYKRWPKEGDSRYMAPELLNTVCRSFTAKADIFSLGISVLELVGNLSLPPNGPLWDALRNNTFPLEQTKDLSDAFFCLVTNMMNKMWSLRPSASDILNMYHIKVAFQKRGARRNRVSQEREILLPCISAWSLLGAMTHLTSQELGLPKSEANVELVPANYRGAVLDFYAKNQYPVKILDAFNTINPSIPKNNGETLVKDKPAARRSTSSRCTSASATSSNSTSSRDDDLSSSSTCTTSSFFHNSDEIGGSQMANSSDSESVIERDQSLQEKINNDLQTSSQRCLKVHSSPVSHFASSSNCEMDHREIKFPTPSIMQFGISPVRLSQEFKEVVKAKKRKRVLTPRNLSLSFEEEFNG